MLPSRLAEWRISGSGDSVTKTLLNLPMPICLSFVAIWQSFCWITGGMSMLPIPEKDRPGCVSHSWAA
jgi:hypothetical protein